MVVTLALVELLYFTLLLKQVLLTALLFPLPLHVFLLLLVFFRIQHLTLVAVTVFK